MKVTFLAQPYAKQLGHELTGLLGSATPTSVTIVSAFVAQQAIRRLKRRVHELCTAGVQVRFVIGVDMGGTSREVLQELATWPIEVFIYKNRRSRVTFHPKLYLVESPDRADLFIGSNNLTDGGLYTNYEGASHVEYALPADEALLEQAKKQLSRFLKPCEPIGRRLDSAYLVELLSRAEIPSEEETQKRKAAAARGPSEKSTAPVFGYESLPSAPSLPKDVLDAVLKDVAAQIDAQIAAKKTAEKAASKTAKGTTKGVKEAAKPTASKNVLSIAPTAQVFPKAFYLELVKTGGQQSQNKKIPGEQRIPLEAVAAARAFWHWPTSYKKAVNPRKGNNQAGSVSRVYHNFYSIWRISEVGNTANNELKEIRLYFYENSSDFRFYSSAISNWGQAGDIVCIAPSDEPGIEYDCQLAKAGTAQHAKWNLLCTQSSSHTKRRYGFA